MTSFFTTASEYDGMQSYDGQLSRRQQDYLLTTQMPSLSESHTLQVFDAPEKRTQWEAVVGEKNLQIGVAWFQNYREWLTVLQEIHVHPITHTLVYGPRVVDFLSGTKENPSPTIIHDAIRDVFVGQTTIPHLTPAQLKRYSQEVASARQPHAVISSTTDIAAQIVPPRSADNERHSFDHLVVRPLSLVIDFTVPIAEHLRHEAIFTQDHVACATHFLDNIPDYLSKFPELSEWKCLKENNGLYLLSPTGNLVRVYDRVARLDFSFINIRTFTPQLLNDIGTLATLTANHAASTFSHPQEKQMPVPKRLFKFMPPRITALP